MATVVRRRADTKLKKARRRSTLSQKTSAALKHLTAAELLSVSAPTSHAYAAAYTAMEEWARAREMSIGSAAQLDGAATMYLDHLFKCGESSAKAKYAVFGTIFCRGLGRGPQSLPRARGALRGFTRDDPPSSRDPMPLEVTASLAMWLSARNDLESKASAVAMVVSFDLFTRPSETLAIKAEDIIAPGVGRFAETSVVIAPSRPGGLDPVPGHHLRPAKNRQFDDTVVVGVSDFPAGFVGKLLRVLKARTLPTEAILAGLCLPAYEKAMAAGVRALGLSALKLTPHSARHGGASSARYLGALDMREIQRRGRWAAASSVRRYDKIGRLTRQVSLTPAAVMTGGDSLLAGSPSRLETALREAADALAPLKAHRQSSARRSVSP